MNAAGMAQGFYFRAGAGYALPVGGQTNDGSSNLFSGTLTRSTQGSTQYDEYKVKKASFNSGAQIALGVGYMLSEHIGIDAAFNIGILPQKNTFEIDNIIVGTIPRNVQLVQQASLPVMFTPSIVMQTAGKKINIYSRVGVVLPVNTTIVWDRIFTTLPGYGAITTDDETWEIKNKFSVGMAAAIGAKKRLNSRLKVSAEISFVSLSIMTKQAKLTKFTSNGRQYSIPDSNSVINFSTSFKSVSNDFYNQTSYSQPFSNMAINIGLTCSLGSSRRKSMPEEENHYQGKNFIKGHKR